MIGLFLIGTFLSILGLGIGYHIGSKKIKEGIDKISDFFGFPILLTDEEKKAHKERIRKLTTEIMPQITKGIEDLEALRLERHKAGEDLTLKEMKKLTELYKEQDKVLKEVNDSKRMLEKQNLASLKKEQEDLKKELDKITNVGPNRLKDAYLKVRDLKKKLANAEKNGNEEEICMIQARLDIAEKQLSLKRDIAKKIEDELKEIDNKIHKEREELDKKGLLKGWEKWAFETNNFTKLLGEKWDQAFTSLGDFAKSIGRWIYTSGEAGEYGTTSAKIFGVSIGFPSVGT